MMATLQHNNESLGLNELIEEVPGPLIYTCLHNVKLGIKLTH